MARRLRKKLQKKPFNVRLSDEERRDLAEAANLESERRREIVGEATLAREFIMRGVHELLIRAGRQPASIVHPGEDRAAA